MSDTTVIPSGASAVVTEDRHHGEHAWEKATLREALATGRDAVQSRERDATTAAQAFASVVGDIKDTRFDLAGITRETGTAGALAAARTDDKIGGATLGMHDRLSGGFAGVHASIDRQGERRDDQHASIASRVDGGFSTAAVLASNLANLASVQSATLAGQASVQATNNFNLAQVQTQNFFNLATIQATDIGNRAAIDRQRFAYEAQIQAQRDASAAVLLATTNQAALAAQIAKCCCEREQGEARIMLEMLRLNTYRVVPPFPATTGGVFPTGA